MLAAGIVQDIFAGKPAKAREAMRRRLEVTSTATSTAQARNSYVS